MRVLVGEGQDLAELYAVPRTPWVRVNFVSTVDGAATGEDGRSGSINNAVDQRVFRELRTQCDVVVIGAGTARAEGYHGIGKPLVLVSRSGQVPVQLRDAPEGDVLMATYAASPGATAARATRAALRSLGYSQPTGVTTFLPDLSSVATSSGLAISGA